MSKFRVLPSLFALAVLAACSTYDPATPAPGVVVSPSAGVVTSPSGAVVSPGSNVVVVPQVATAPAVIALQPVALRAGIGRVDSIATIPSMASAGASAPSNARRIGVKMDDGTAQFIDSNAQGLAIGDRLEITRDGFIRRPAP